MSRQQNLAGSHRINPPVLNSRQIKFDKLYELERGEGENLRLNRLLRLLIGSCDSLIDQGGGCVVRGV